MAPRHDSAAFAGWLGLAAAPSFAAMALATSLLERGAADILCAGQGASPLGGMPLMYMLMSLFHLAPWLRLIAIRRTECGCRPSNPPSDRNHDDDPSLYRRLRLPGDPLRDQGRAGAEQ